MRKRKFLGRVVQSVAPPKNGSRYENGNHKNGKLKVNIQDISKSHYSSFKEETALGLWDKKSRGTMSGNKRSQHLKSNWK